MRSRARALRRQLLPVLGGFVVLLPTQSHALTATVPGDYPTIQMAIDGVQSDADPGEVIIESSGAFVETLLISESVTIRGGDGFFPVIEKSSGSGSPVTIRANQPSDTVVELENLGVLDLRTGGSVGILVFNEQAGWDLDVALHEVSVELLEGDQGLRGGSGSMGPIDFRITDSSFQVVGDGSGGPACLRIDPSGAPATFFAAGNTFRFSRAFGLALKPGKNAAIDSILLGNTFEGFSQNGFEAFFGIDFGGTNAPGNIAAQALVANNLFVGTDGAIDANGQGENDLEFFFNNNTVSGCRSRCMSVQAFGDSSVTANFANNIVSGAEGYGIESTQGQTATVNLNNTNNLYFDNTLGDFGGDAMAGPDAVFAAPLFVDGGAGDYRLQTGSPAIDAGNDMPAGGLPQVDFDGMERILDGDGFGGARVDIGAFEAPTLVLPPIAVPTLSSWGLVAMAMMIVGLGIWRARRREA